MNTTQRVLIDKEKLEIDGNPAYRLFFYDEHSGIIYKVISFIGERDIMLNKPTQEPAEVSSQNEIEELMR